MGLPIVFILALVGLVHKNAKDMFWITLKAIGITMLVAFVTGLIGLTVAELFLNADLIGGFMPFNVVDKESFAAVGFMHNFSYLGGLTGLIGGCIYTIRHRRKI